MSLGDLTLELILLQLFTGLALGSIYVLLAIGLSLIFGMLTVVNFAHGAMFMAGAYAGLSVFQATGSFWLALVGAPIAVAAIGLVAERFLIRPLYGKGIDYPLLVTFGLAYVIVDSVRMIYGKVGMPFPQPEMLQGATNIGIGFFPTYRLFVLAAAFIILVGLYLLIEKTRWGLIIRAGARDPTIVKVLGVDVSKVWLVVFGLGSALAAIGGVLAAPLQGVTPEMGNTMLVEAFVVTVIGGMGSLVGAIIAGLLVGVVVSMTSLIVPEMAQVSIFALMAAILLVRPQGLFGKAGLMS
jgi:branched-chain amino acid transport system permease protein